MYRPGDVPITYADSKALEEDYSFTQKIPIREGLRKFAEWYTLYFGCFWDKECTI